MSTQGDRIADRYELVAKLGQGGMGVVWRARDQRLGRVVAVKLLSGSSIGNEIARTRLIREARAAAALEHDGIIRIYDVGETSDGGAYLVMEMIKGKSLRDHLLLGSLTLAERAVAIVEAARALEFAHEANIVHRDVKPDNIMIRESDGRVTVVDFGVAKPLVSTTTADANNNIVNAETIAGVTAESLTGAGQLVGTPAYLAPEQARGIGVGPATDQWALAITAFEMFTKKIPWDGDGVVDVVAALLRDDAPAMSQFLGKATAAASSSPSSKDTVIPSAYDAVIVRALAKDPKDRFPSMGAFADAFEAVTREALDGGDIALSRAAVRTRRSTPNNDGAPSSSSSSSSSSPAQILADPISPAAFTQTPSAPANAVAPTPLSTAVSSGGKIASAAANVPSKTTTTTTTTESRPFWKSGAFLGAAVVIVALGGGWLVSQRGTSSSITASAEGGSTSTSAAQAPFLIACPPLEVIGSSTSANEDAWLGAPAAALACERLQLAHGAIDARTIVPAELAEVSRSLNDPPAHVFFEMPNFRAPMIERAKTRAPRWLDGTIERQPNVYNVTLILRESKTNAELARGTGRAVEIFEAVREAMGPIVKANPPTKEEMATLRENLDVDSLEGAFALLDLRTAALIEDPVALKESCAAIVPMPSLIPRVKYLARSTCAQKLRSGELKEPPPPIDESTPGALMTTALAQGKTGGVDALRERVALLDKHAQMPSLTAETRSRLWMASAELLNLIGDGPHSKSHARDAVQESPKAYDWRSFTWHRLAFTSEGDASIQTSLASWNPWEPISQMLRAQRTKDASPESLQVILQRAFYLSRRGYYASAYGQNLLYQGRIEGAQAIAESTNDDLLRMQIRIGEGKYGEVYKAIPVLLAKLPADDANASLAFRLAHVGVSAALTLEKPADFVDDIIKRFVESEPHHVVDGVVPFVALITTCCFAPKAAGKRCIERLQRLRTESKLPTVFGGTDTVVTGAAHFVDGDYAAAAKSWRTMLRAPGWIQDELRDPMAIAFDKSGSPELGDEIDMPTVATLDQPRPAELAWVRAARRAWKRGDREQGQKLAQRIIEKWRFADEDIPAMREMKEMLAKAGH